MADKIDPNSNDGKISSLLPTFYRTDANKKFLHATIEQLTQRGTVKTINGYIGRQNAKAATGDDIFVETPTLVRQNYQLEPSLIIKDTLNNNSFFKDYQDYINQIDVFGGNVKNHARVNKQEFYSWDPHVDWDKFTNFQNYYWLPYGPDVITIYGEPESVESTFTVRVESELGNYAYIFTPNGLDRNPTIKLYRGVTYKFKITSPGNPFSIKTTRTAGSLDRYVIPGIDNYAVENGTITFSVPYNSPDILYYISEFDADLGGLFHVESILENTYINVEESIVGKLSYTLSDGTALSNGMKVAFAGDVYPEYYANKQFYVEGVGSQIALVYEKDLELISAYTESTAVLFDTTPFDKMPFSDATAYPGAKDYITINRSSRDHNPWSRYNRWFHKDVIEASAKYNNKVASVDQEARAIRPIIEFEPNLKLFNFGTDALHDVDLVDTFTKDAFSTVEGALGYNVDGVSVTQGHRIIFTAETDINVRNKIYRAEFIKVQTSSKQLTFTPITDVNITKDTITFPAQHLLSTRNAVVYNSNGNNAIDGLTSLSTYYVRDIDGYSLALYYDVELTNRVDIVSTFDRGRIYTFSLEEISGGTPTGILIPYSVYETDIDAVSNQIKFTQPHEYTDGTLVKYRASNNNSMQGPVTGSTYYIQVIDSYTIVLNENYNGVSFSNPVDIIINKVVRPHLLVTYETNRQIHLVEDDIPVENNVVLVREGINNQGEMFWFDGINWTLAQQKLITNQHPKFDVVDNNGISFGDTSTYNGSTFTGSQVFSYKIGSGTNDSILNFPLSYKNIANIGDIVFNFDLATDTFEYNNVTNIISHPVNVGYLIKTNAQAKITYLNGWQQCNTDTTQAAIRIYKNQINNFKLDLFDKINDLSDLSVKVYVNGVRLDKVGSNVPIIVQGVASFLVTYYIPLQTSAPAVGSSYTVDSRQNPSFEGTFEVVESTTTSVTLSYPADPGIYVTDDTTLTLNILSKPIVVLNVSKQTSSNEVRFTIPKQEVAPKVGSFYKVESNNFTFNGEYAVIDSGLTYVTLQYAKSPGEFVSGVTKLTQLNWYVLSNTGVYKTIVLNSDITTRDILTIKAYAAQPINNNGYYEIPVNLQNNPLNEFVGEFTLGEVIDHVNSIVDNLNEFVGVYPGINNIRDLGNITQFGTKFVQHSGPISLSMYHVTTQDNNIIRAIEKSREDYVKFKKNFIKYAESVSYENGAIDAVNEILEKINKDVPNTFPYYFSDMVPFKAGVKTELPVVDYRIKTYPLTEVFSLSTVTSTAVLVYHKSLETGVTTQLLHEHDYTFDTQGFVVISAALNNDDTIIIYEFSNTNGSFVPATPSKLGIWPKFDPKIYEDTTLVTPQTMIQGHDGSLVLSYGDYRDDLILELEKRIYNNIKVEYDPSIFDFADVIPGYSRETDYTLDEFNQILSPNFYKWTSLIDRDFSKPLSYDRNNPMTFNYKDQYALNGQPVPGYWRGIYRWMLDTDRPNLCPWEMLGFSDQPTWWEGVYGAAPYTSDNFKLWQDLSDGAICEPGKPIVRNKKFERPFLKNIVPVDDQGNIVSPIIAGFTSGIITESTEGDFVFGDVSPIESAWRRSSGYTFSVLLAAMLMYPAKTFGTLLDRSRVVRNLAGQIVYKDTGVFITPKDVTLPCIYSDPSDRLTAGIINYVIDYILSDNLKSYKQYRYDLLNLQARLSYRIGSFTSKEKFNLLLDSKTPLSSGSVFVPQEDFEIILNSSSPIKKITYSAVVITKVSDGFDVKGYSQTQPFFYYYPWVTPGNTFNVGGISESFVTWTPNQYYEAGKIVEFNNKYYRVKVSHAIDVNFDIQYYALLPTLPIVGGRNAYLRTGWDRSNPIVVPYGTKFATIQEVVDFLLGYGEYLKDQGFIFDEFNSQLNAVTNWETSAKEFLFWTTQNWSSGEDKWKEWSSNNSTSYGEIVRYNGDYYRAVRDSEASPVFIEEDFVLLDGLSSIGSSVLSVSPAAAKITFKIPLSIVDDIRNPFYVYEILQVDGSPIEPKFINSFRNATEVSYAPKSDNGIYGATFYLVQKEQVVVLNNSTIFNDTIYSPSTGYRQERIKVFGYVGSEWTGAFDVPGFIFDQARVDSWEEWTDYHLGDIVKYKQYYYSAKYFISGKESFTNNDWIKLDYEPTPKLLPNWTYKASQFTDFYDLDSDNFDSAQQTMAQHLIGYQQRQYLSNIIKNNVSEYKFYQGMIVEKGTRNVFNKLFDVLSAEGKESLSFYEEWALRVGQYGASAAFENIEFVLDESLFKTNPQGFELINVLEKERNDLIIQQTPNDLYVKPLGYKSNPWPVLSNFTSYLRTPGYVRPNEVSLILRSLTDILFADTWDSTVYYSINTTVNYDGLSYISITENVNTIPSSSTDDWKLFNISTLNNGDYVWCGFEGREWNVYRFVNANLHVNDVVDTDGSLSIVFRDLAPFAVGDIIGIGNVAGISGFYKVKDVVLDTIVLDTTVTTTGIFTEQSNIRIYNFKSLRYSSIDALKDAPILNSKANDLIWIDNSLGTKSATWKYNTAYSSRSLTNIYPQDHLKFGKTVTVNKAGTIAAVVDVQGTITTYIKQPVLLSWVNYQGISSPFYRTYPSLYSTPVSNVIGDVLVMSQDSHWLVVGSPNVSNVCSKYRGEWNISLLYSIGDIITSGLRYYRALANFEFRSSSALGSITGTVLTTVTNNLESEIFYVGQLLSGTNVVDGTKIIAIGTVANTYIINISQTVTSTVITGNELPPALNKSAWEELNYLPVDETGTNSTRINEGIISIYQKNAIDEFELVDTILSPRLGNHEKFGSSLAFSGNTLFVGSNNNVYQLEYGNTVKATARYVASGSQGYIVKLSTVEGIKVGMTITGNGFTLGQTVASVNVLNQTITVSALPDSDSYGMLSFSVTGWAYSYKTVTTTVQGYNSAYITVDDETGIQVGSLVTGYGFVSGQIVSSIEGTHISLNLEPEVDPSVGDELSFDVLVRYTPTGDDTEFGYSLDVSEDRSTFLISAPDVTKVYVYKKDELTYILSQVIEDQTVALDDQDTRFGESISVSNDGSYITIASKLSNVTELDEGKVEVYRYNGTTYITYQVLADIDPERTGLFGSKVSFMNDYKTLVVYSQNAETYTATTFDEGLTIFDDSTTNFARTNENTGRVDIYDRYNDFWVYSESLVNDLEMLDGYGTSIAVGQNTILVSASYALDNNLHSGAVYEYSKNNGTYSWSIVHYETNKIDIKKIKQAFLYNKVTNKLVTYLDVLDPIQGKIPGVADQEIRFKTFYDPATYSVGIDSVRVDDGMAWSDQQVGMLWWDLRTCKFIDSYSNDVVYRNSTWSTLFLGANVDVYEWVESTLLPSEWNDLADTEEGLTENISGRTLYGDTVYSVIRKYDNISQSFKNTYYYWVKNKNTIPDVDNRRMSAQDVSNLISNPRGSGYKYLVLNGTNSFSLVNVQSLLQDKDVVLSVEYWTVDNIEQNIHTQWSLISNDVNSKIPEKIEQKWFDSLCGKDLNDRVVPDYNLPIKLRYGVENRPRQGMFINRYEALKQVIDQTNRVMAKYQIAEERDISNLELYDTEPSIITGLYDIVLDTDAELRFSGIGSFVKAKVTPILIDGKITGVTITNGGKNYGRLYPKTYDSSGEAIEWYGPNIEVIGSGFNAFIKTVIDNRGQVIDTIIESEGYGYNDDTMLTVRNYAALVHSDSQANSQWSIYTYEPITKLWSRTLIQSFDTRKYWSYIDWYDPTTNYSSVTAYDYIIDTFADLNTITTKIGNLVKVATTNSNNWVLLEKYADSTSIDWTQQYKIVGSQRGTIKFSSLLYEYVNTVYGYDGALYDANIFDDAASRELRIILTTLKNNILIDTLKQEYLNLLFTSIRYALSEQTHLDWAFKTSFIKAQHNVGELKEKVTYNNDNLPDFESYVSEVKPYRTKVREYISNYSKTDTSQLSTTDFDLPSTYDESVRTTVKTRTIDVVTTNSTIQASDAEIITYPWKHWLENVGFSIVDIRIVNGGSGYISEPVVRITGGGGSSAKARAFIANGKVNRIVLLNPGKEYLSAPTIVIDGGLDTYGDAANAVAIIGNSVIRTNLIKMKFDRVTQTYFINQLQEVETFVGTGSRTQFALTWGPDVRIGHSEVVVDGVKVLRDDYKLAIIKSTARGYTSYSGTVTLATSPAKDAKITVTYIKDWSLLNAADRIQYYYNPTTGELGKDLSQLMTGVDYGGVVVTGLNFEVNSGWDSLNYSSNKWDDFDHSTEDYMTVAEVDQHEFTLPDYFPVPDGTKINVYYVNDGVTIRIDDPYFDAEDQTNKDAVMLTWESDGTSKTITLPPEFTVLADTKFIFRKTTSDGSVAPAEDNYDTSLSGGYDSNGYLGYQTATGLAAEDIIVDGDGLVTPTTSPATEEVVPGQVVDALAIKVFDKAGAGSSAIKVDSYVADGVQTDFRITQQPNSSQAVIVKFVRNSIDFATNEATTVSEIKLINVDFTVEYQTNYVKFDDAPPSGTYVSIFSIGFNGSDILDIGNFVGNGTQVRFTTDALWTSPLTPLIYVNGEPESNVSLIKSGTTNRVVLNFTVPPAADSLVSYIIVNSDTQTFAITKSERFVGNGTNTYRLENRVGNALLAESNMIVRVNQKILDGPSNSYFTIANNRLSYTLDQTNIPPFSVNADDILVIVGDTVLSQLIDYTVDLKGITVKISRNVYKLYAGRTLMISSRINGGYLYSEIPVNSSTIMQSSKIIGTALTVGSMVSGTIAVGMILTGTGVRSGTKILSGSGLNWIVNISQSVPPTTISGQLDIIPTITFAETYTSSHAIEVISSYNHDILDIESSLVDMSVNATFTPNTVAFYENQTVKSGRISLDRTVINDYYVWVVKNGVLLTPSVDYKLDDDRQTVILAESPTDSDKFRIMTFGSNVLGSGISYMQFKDMLNRTHYKRLNASKQTQLTKTLNNNDLSIEVVDASNFDVPNPALNKPGIIEIRGERIEYFKIEGNVLSQLRRGTLGTGTPPRHEQGSYVQDIGPSETIPYTDTSTVSQTVYNLDYWKASTAYSVNDTVLDDNKTYACIVAHTSSALFASDFTDEKWSLVGDGYCVLLESIDWFNKFGLLLTGDYNTSTSYPVNTVVIYNQEYYVNILASTNISPASTIYWKPLSDMLSSFFEVFVGGYDTSMSWEPNTIYNANDIVNVGSYLYRTSAKIKTGETFTKVVSILDDNNEILTENVASSSVWSFFVGNIRLKKSAYAVHNVDKHPESPEGNITFSSDFTVDNSIKYIKLSNPLQSGTYVTIITKSGEAWDTFTDIRTDTDKISQFIKAVPGIQYKDVVNYELQRTITFSSTLDQFDETDKTIE